MRTRTKAELNSHISKIDLIDFVTIQIDKKSSDAAKKVALKKFTDLASTYVADIRNVELIAVKIK